MAPVGEGKRVLHAAPLTFDRRLPVARGDGAYRLLFVGVGALDAHSYSK